MANSTLDSVLEMVAPEIKEALSARLGESQLTIQAGLKTATAVTLTAIASKANGTNFLSQFLNLVGAATHQPIWRALIRSRRSA